MGSRSGQVDDEPLGRGDCERGPGNRDQRHRHGRQVADLAAAVARGKRGCHDAERRPEECRQASGTWKAAARPMAARATIVLCRLASVPPATAHRRRPRPGSRAPPASSVKGRPSADGQGPDPYRRVTTTVPALAATRPVTEVVR